LGTVTVSSITQTATNAAGSTISNTGTMTTGGISGNGASASISAVGAGAFVSFSAMK
jgi:hypothetical protein